MKHIDFLFSRFLITVLKQLPLFCHCAPAINSIARGHCIFCWLFMAAWYMPVLLSETQNEEFEGGEIIHFSCLCRYIFQRQLKLLQELPISYPVSQHEKICSSHMQCTGNLCQRDLVSSCVCDSYPCIDTLIEVFTGFPIPYDFLFAMEQAASVTCNVQGPCRRESGKQACGHVILVMPFVCNLLLFLTTHNSTYGSDF